MKKLINILKKSIIFYIIIYLFIFFFTKFFLNLYNLEFRNWIYYLSTFLIAIAITFTFIKSILKENTKKIYIFFKSFTFIFIEAIFIIIILSGLYVIKGQEKIMYNKYIKVKYPLTLLHQYNYYEYVNFFVRGTNNINEWDL